MLNVYLGCFYRGWFGSFLCFFSLLLFLKHFFRAALTDGHPSETLRWVIRNALPVILRERRIRGSTLFTHSYILFYQVNWDYVRCLPDGETVSVDGTSSLVILLPDIFPASYQTITVILTNLFPPNNQLWIDKTKPNQNNSLLPQTKIQKARTSGTIFRIKADLVTVSTSFASQGTLRLPTKVYIYNIKWIPKSGMQIGGAQLSEANLLCRIPFILCMISISLIALEKNNNSKSVLCFVFLTPGLACIFLDCWCWILLIRIIRHTPEYSIHHAVYTQATLVMLHPHIWFRRKTAFSPSWLGQTQVWWHTILELVMGTKIESRIVLLQVVCITCVGVSWWNIYRYSLVWVSTWRTPESAQVPR